MLGRLVPLQNSKNKIKASKIAVNKVSQNGVKSSNDESSVPKVFRFRCGAINGSVLT